MPKKKQQEDENIEHVHQLRKASKRLQWFHQFVQRVPWVVHGGLGGFIVAGAINLSPHIAFGIVCYWLLTIWLMYRDTQTIERSILHILKLMSRNGMVLVKEADAKHAGLKTYEVTIETIKNKK